MIMSPRPTSSGPCPLRQERLSFGSRPATSGRSWWGTARVRDTRVRSLAIMSPYERCGPSATRGCQVIWQPRRGWRPVAGRAPWSAVAGEAASPWLKMTPPPRSPSPRMVSSSTLESAHTVKGFPVEKGASASPASSGICTTASTACPPEGSAPPAEIRAGKHLLPHGWTTH